MTTENHRHTGRVRDEAFTLIEIVVALTIIAVISSIAIPTLRGLERDEKIRTQLKSLAELVQDVRQRAIHERRAYQIVFEREGFHASEVTYPFEKRGEFLKYLDELRTPSPMTVSERTEVQRQDVANAHAPEDASSAEEVVDYPPPWTLSVPLPEGTECDVLMWGDGEWDDIDGEKIRRWVFQPSGMVNPVSVRLRTGDAELEGKFDILTGELTGQRATLVAKAP
jgi:prepilin-type N-terminal cleavage/methylation domain-containing protein